MRLRQEIWLVLRTASMSRDTTLLPDLLLYVDRLVDELLLTTVESFYSTSVRELETRAIRDVPTQLYNKEYFRQRLQEELRRSVRYAEPMGIVMIDMDELKTINDSYGHAAGDEALRALASSIKTTCRQTDVPCRIGGDEFAVILPETTKAQARSFAERIMQTVHNLSVMVVPGEHQAEKQAAILEVKALSESDLAGRSTTFVPPPTVSIGLAAYPEDARNPEMLLAKADAALYRAKNEGRNRIAD